METVTKLAVPTQLRCLPVLIAAVLGALIATILLVVL